MKHGKRSTYNHGSCRCDPCMDAMRAYAATYAPLPRDRKKDNATRRRRYHERRLVALERLGGKCATCGCPDSLQFDHVNPTTKEIAMDVAFCRSQPVIDAELLKCQLLCISCHSKKTWVETYA